MTTHPTPAERLLAILADEQAFESLPAEDVRAELASVGIDPAHCIAFDLKPGRQATAASGGDCRDDGRQAPAGFGHGNCIARPNLKRWHVDGSIVDGEVPVADELPRLRAGAGESEPPDDVVEPSL